LLKHCNISCYLKQVHQTVQVLYKHTIRFKHELFTISCYRENLESANYKYLNMKLLVNTCSSHTWMKRNMLKNQARSPFGLEFKTISIVFLAHHLEWIV